MNNTTGTLSAAPGPEPPAPVSERRPLLAAGPVNDAPDPIPGFITQGSLKCALSHQRSLAEIFEILRAGGTVEPGPLRVDPVAVRMRIPRMVLEENEAPASPCPPQASHGREFTPAAAITQNALRRLRVAEEFAVCIREVVAGYVRAGLPCEPGPLTLDAGAVREPIFASVIGTSVPLDRGTDG